MANNLQGKVFNKTLCLYHYYEILKIRLELSDINQESRYAIKKWGYSKISDKTLKHFLNENIEKALEQYNRLISYITPDKKKQKKIFKEISYNLHSQPKAVIKGKKPKDKIKHSILIYSFLEFHFPQEKTTGEVDNTPNKKVTIESINDTYNQIEAFFLVNTSLTKKEIQSLPIKEIDRRIKLINQTKAINALSYGTRLSLIANSYAGKAATEAFNALIDLARDKPKKSAIHEMFERVAKQHGIPIEELYDE